MSSDIKATTDKLAGARISSDSSADTGKDISKDMSAAADPPTADGCSSVSIKEAAGAPGGALEATAFAAVAAESRRKDLCDMHLVLARLPRDTAEIIARCASELQNILHVGLLDAHENGKWELQSI